MTGPATPFRERAPWALVTGPEPLHEAYHSVKGRQCQAAQLIAPGKRVEIHRSELTALERDRLVSEWCELVGEKPVQDEPVSSRVGGRGNKGGSREAERQLGLDHADVVRARKVASLSPEAQEKAVELGLDDNRSAPTRFRARCKCLMHGISAILRSCSRRPTVCAPFDR